MKKIGLLFLPFYAVLALTACDTTKSDGVEFTNEKKLTNSKVEFAGVIEGTELQRNIVTLWSVNNATKADDFSKADVNLSMELITPHFTSFTSLPAGDYNFSTIVDKLVLADSDNSTINVFTSTSYGGDKAKINGGKVSISFFNDKYEIKGEVTDVNGRTLEFTFYNKLEFIAPKPSFTIDFEESQLTAQTSTYSNILWGKEKAADVEGKSVFNGILYTETPASFGSYYAFDGEYESWGGFALSSNRDLTDLGWDYTNQFSVYAPEANKFAIGYPMGDWGGEYGNPIIEFEKTVTVLSADIANANKTYHYCISNPKVGEGESQEDIWVNLIITGYKSDAKTKEMTVKLANGAEVLADWKSYDFSSLGDVDKLTFAIDSNSKNQYGLLVPTFFCIDNISIK